ncbi:DoxX family protein [Corynebacterium sp. LK2510]|uniref:DoxX family protein n=1 Tax=Corynebacterium sp. LK2510 TaxID=3110472 RepID=UPI0034CDD299
MNRPAVRDFALLLVRLIAGAVFVARGYRSWFQEGIARTAEELGKAGVPQPKLSAYLSSTVELIGGSLLIIGLLTTLVAGLLMLVVLAAAYFVHLNQGFFVETGGIEYPLVLAVVLFVIVVFGSGRASLDRALTSA